MRSIVKIGDLTGIRIFDFSAESGSEAVELVFLGDDLCHTCRLFVLVGI